MREQFKYFVKAQIALRILATVLFLCTFVICGIILIRYGLNWFNTECESKTLNTIYYSSKLATEELKVMATPIAEKISVSMDAAPATSLPIMTHYPWLSNYPNNPYLTISSTIKKLQRQNKDIIGWLHIDDMLDDAIVQKDNTYYLKRDYKGYHNVNGALFLEQSCDLTNRPLLYMIYGHNMKTGAMFGSLRNWENQTFYHKNPFVHFEALYEEGDYVIFSVGTMSELVLSKGLLIYSTSNATYAQQQLADFIKALVNGSIYTNCVNVSNDDQLLLLITCDGKDDERRVIAARRVRDNENIDDLRKIIQKNRKRR